MAIKKRKVVLTLLMAGLMAGSITAHAEVPSVDVKTVTTPDTSSLTIRNGVFTVQDAVYQTYDQNDDPMVHFENVEIDGIVYGIRSAGTPKYIRKDTVSPQTTVYTSEVWTGDGEDQKPDEKIEQDGITYKLKNLYKEERESEKKTEIKQATIQYVGVEDGIEIPQEKAITFTDVDTKQEVTAELPLSEETQTDEYWDDSFEFDITISGYNADTYLLGEKEISSSADLMDYREDLLRLLSLNSEKYEITSIEWNGNSYTEDDQVKRKAVGKGRKLVRDVTAMYEGEVTLPGTQGYVWVADYEQDIPDGQTVIYTMAADVEYAPVTADAKESSWFEKAIDAIVGVITAAYTALAASFKEHPVATSIPFVVAAGLIAFLITKKVRNRCIYNNAIQCPHKKHDKETCKSCPNFYKRGSAPKIG